LEHDIKVTKNHQNLLPTQTLIVAYTVVMYEGHPESKVTRAPEAGGNCLFRSWRTWHVGGILAVSLFGPVLCVCRPFCSVAINFSDEEVVARSRHLRFAQEGEAFLDSIVTEE
jgi:hypothetical protein